MQSQTERNLTRAYFALERALGRMCLDLGKASKYEQTGRYSFIPAEPDRFAELCSTVHKVLGRSDERCAWDVKFLDVGCGIGTKVLLASIFFNAYGLEYNKTYVKMARKLVGNDSNPDKIIEADALVYDGYGNYDVIYFYTPIHDHKMRLDMEERVVSQAKSGALFIVYSGYVSSHDARAMLEPVTHKHVRLSCIYRKK